MTYQKLSSDIISASIEVHKKLGPGLLESSYEACLAYEFSERNISFERQVPLPIHYKNVQLDCGYRLDFVVNEIIIIELKSVETLLPIHTAQTLTYLRLSHLPLALLLNFNSQVLKDGIRRLINTKRS